MARAQRTPFVILGLLALSRRQPRSGYEIKKVIDTVIAHVWSESHGQLYPVLKQLAADGLVSARVGKGARKKILYTITAKGRERLRAWLDAAVESSPPRDELVLKLFFGTEGDVGALIRHLEADRERSRAILQQCHEWEKENAAHPERYSAFTRLPIRAGIIMTEARLHWAEESLTTLNAMHPKRRKS